MRVESWRFREACRKPDCKGGQLSTVKLSRSRHVPSLTIGLLTQTYDGPNFFIDEFELLFYYRLNTGKEVIKKYMSSNHSEVAET